MAFLALLISCATLESVATTLSDGEALLLKVRQKAEAIFKDPARTSGSVTLHREGEAFLKEEKFGKAAVRFYASMLVEPTEAQIKYSLANTLMHWGRYRKSWSLLHEAAIILNQTLSQALGLERLKFEDIVKPLQTSVARLFPEKIGALQDLLAAGTGGVSEQLVRAGGRMPSVDMQLRRDAHRVCAPVGQLSGTSYYWDRYFEHYEQRGLTHSVHVARFHEEGQPPMLGLAASRDFKKHEVILSLSIDALVSVTNIVLNPGVGSMFRDSDGHIEQKWWTDGFYYCSMIVLYLMWSQLHPESSDHLYASHLASIDTPLGFLWDPAEQVARFSEDLLLWREAILDYALSMYDQVVKPLRKKYHAVLGSQHYDYAHFLKWYALYRTRHLNEQRVGTFMSPVVDMLNHAPASASKSSILEVGHKIENGKKSLDVKLKAGSDIRRGEQLFLTYKGREGLEVCQEFMMAHWGFSTTSNSKCQDSDYANLWATHDKTDVEPSYVKKWFQKRGSAMKVLSRGPLQESGEL